AVLNVNLKGAFNFIHHVTPHFREKNRGKIVNVSSINGLRGKFGLANYAASKAGLIGLTKTVAKELGRYNVNVNAVAPGFVTTPLTLKLPEKFINESLEETVLGRLATPEDIANVIFFLCSDLARHITGEVIKVDGGQYI
ncbi:MAG: SDR family oxidoreductase, partial [bacterium]